MKLIYPSFEVQWPHEYELGHYITDIVNIARTCYRSHISSNYEDSKAFVKRLIDNGHEAMLEHKSLTVKLTVDRGVTHELVRHRMASFAQESTRYCNYSGEKFRHDVRFVIPCFFDERKGTDKSEQFGLWLDACQRAEEMYFALLQNGATPQEARTVLPNSTAADIVVTANFREWRHILKLRTAKDAHPQMREVMCPLGEELKARIPVIFDDCVTAWRETT